MRHPVSTRCHWSAPRHHSHYLSQARLPLLLGSPDTAATNTGYNCLHCHSLHTLGAAYTPVWHCHPSCALLQLEPYKYWRCAKLCAQVRESASLRSDVKLIWLQATERKRKSNWWWLKSKKKKASIYVIHVTRSVEVEGSRFGAAAPQHIQTSHFFLSWLCHSRLSAFSSSACHPLITR